MSPNLPWNPQRPEAVVITCVDGRWYRHFQEFAKVHLEAGMGTDFMAVPGGIEPMTLADDVPKDFNFFRRRLEALVEAHGTRRIVVIAHQDCAWYRARMTTATPEVIRTRQIADMRRARLWLRARFPGVTVEPYFARLSDSKPEKVGVRSRSNSPTQFQYPSRRRAARRRRPCRRETGSDRRSSASGAARAEPGRCGELW